MAINHYNFFWEGTFWISGCIYVIRGSEGENFFFSVFQENRKTSRLMQILGVRSIVVRKAHQHREYQRNVDETLKSSIKYEKEAKHR